MNSRKILLSIGISILLLGCNGGENKKAEAENNQQKISIPKEINIEIPKALKDDSIKTDKVSKRVQKQHKEGLGESRGFLQLKEEIAQLEFMKNDLEINLLLVVQLMGDIESHCQEVPLGTTCTIEANQLSITLNQDIIDEIDEMTGENNSDILGETIPIGEVKFTQYQEEKEFQYALDMEIEEEGQESSTQTIKWSKDENRIWTSYACDDSDYKDEMSISYIKKANGEREMRTDDTYLEKESGGKGSFHFNIVQLSDEDEHFKVTSSAEDSLIFDGKREKSSFSSQGEISKKGGFLIFTGIFGDDKFKEKELFDGEGSVVSSSYCDTQSSCDLNDDSTWLEYGDDSFELDEINITLFEDMEDTNMTEEMPINADPIGDGLPIFPISVTGGNLQDGEYLLYNPSALQGINISEANEPMLTTWSEDGNLYLNDGKVVSAYLDIPLNQEEINALVLIQQIIEVVDEGSETERWSYSYREVTDSDRPTITLITEP